MSAEAISQTLSGAVPTGMQDDNLLFFRSSMVWRNLGPARVWTCRLPHRQAEAA